MKKKKQLNKRANTLAVNVTSNTHQSRFASAAKFAKKGLTPVHVPFPTNITVSEFPVAPSVIGRRRQLKLKAEEEAATEAEETKEAADGQSGLDSDDDDDDIVRTDVARAKAAAAIILSNVSASYHKKSAKQRVELVTNVSKSVLILLCKQRGLSADVYEKMNFKQIMTHVRSLEPMIHIQELIAVQEAAAALQTERKTKFAEIKSALKASGRDRASIKQKKREEAAAKRRAAREEQEDIVRRKRAADEAEAKRRGVPYVAPLPRKKRQKLDVYGMDREAERRRRAEETSSSDDDSDDSELEPDSESSQDEDERNAKRHLIWSRKRRRTLDAAEQAAEAETSSASQVAAESSDSDNRAMSAG